MFFLASPADEVAPAHRQAIVTVLVGETYEQVWRVMCQSNWQAYADRHGFDLIGIAHRPDMSPRGQARSPAWQKLLVLDQPWSAAYDRIVWIDADIVIAGDAPNILREVPDPTKIGASISGAQFSEAEKHIYFERLHNVTVDPQLAPLAWRFTEDNGYAESEIDGEGAPMLNTGVLVMSPQHHNALLKEIYATESASRLYEQPGLSREIARRGLLTPITPRFNWVIHERRFLDFADIETVEHPDMPRLINHLRNELSKAYFLHFAGSMSIMQHLARLSQETGEPWWTPQG
ncbi:hypothetical protein JKL49_08790 [Phenylobacterium sp. 20VBR1]|uniref:Uncharacterized protein n=1 Tax=Phenylobacterium glaciei TaxID=2803784 RepID=A0A941D252_9CAUL|nr:hypothetical protein [Phenylobacterium glaciei]MBR7619481.1 hypothetical protein [Phenylobacterium glaciei]